MIAATSSVALRLAIMPLNLLDALKGRSKVANRPRLASQGARVETLQSPKTPARSWSTSAGKDMEAVRLACEVSVRAADSDLEGAAGHPVARCSVCTLVASRMRLCEADT